MRAETGEQVSTKTFTEKFQVKILSKEEKDRLFHEIVANCDLVGDCWVFKGSKTPAGYGVKKFRGTTLVVSRFMLCYHTRESYNIKADACHVGDCPYKACCNPLHLCWGSHAANSIQREQEKRERQKEMGWYLDSSGKWVLPGSVIDGYPVLEPKGVDSRVNLISAADVDSSVNRLLALENATVNNKSPVFLAS